MSEPEVFKGGKTQYVWVKDRAGNEYICPSDTLKHPKDASEAELKNCVDDAGAAGINPRGG